jgi:hypothetical protein
MRFDNENRNGLNVETRKIHSDQHEICIREKIETVCDAAIGATQWLIRVASSGGSARQKYPRMAVRAIGYKFRAVEPPDDATRISHWVALTFCSSRHSTYSESSSQAIGPFRVSNHY